MAMKIDPGGGGSSSSATKVPVHPTKPKKATTTKKLPSATKSTGGTSAVTSGSSSGGSSGGASSAERRAVARENSAKRKAGKRFIESANTLERQAKALRHALTTDFAKARDNNLADVGRVLASQLAQLKLGQGQRADTFLDAASNTEKATASSAEQGYGNFSRERADSMSAILDQGAGESDTARAMLIAARNWQANTQEANRAYFDSLQTVNSGIVDLNVDTRGAMANAWTSAEGERDRLWQDFYNKRSETFTQLGNIKGQQADYYAQAKEMGVGSKGKDKKSKKDMSTYYMDASKEAGKSYTQKDLPDEIANYAGLQKVEGKLSNTNLGATVEIKPTVKAEGSTLRKWA